ncbi:xanthine dehydrogenase accessory protein PucB [Shouchella clausii]|uniref:xanthine dehydrogenase accessory protein PucB n=1 Tax=Shouchella TaxID=2893057 RepID=UPI0004E7B816|nr:MULTISPECIES: xanthine dehydrogenase accessory protein PucB [Shouchella]ALA53290.1 CTP:molybdopterin cytidylyltransferase [Shouchella clausii]MBU3231176.1 xanthine dehydrogenase accessory protein PucB [Shouchella clausii]MBU3263820.1 xanthine dehydrogenase accessory protein PucB [Shouchella clausii]MBU3508218.1 xanthine dehydrogenase accessory protein PucB [Shouchella clausii]MBU3534281.1 xanthine dehydrogenase accessory protein PucB [Shouchella clausii]
MKTVAICLAAGQSARMGENKLALPLLETTVGSASLKTALGTDVAKIVVVIGEKYGHTSWLDPKLLADRRIMLVYCRKAAEGQAESLKCGLEVAGALGASAVLILLADQPFLPASVIKSVLATAKGRPDATSVSACYKGKKRPPALFRQSLFVKLHALAGDEGARAVLRKDKSSLAVPVADASAFFDIDTKEDYQWACRHLQKWK